MTCESVSMSGLAILSLVEIQRKRGGKEGQPELRDLFTFIAEESRADQAVPLFQPKITRRQIGGHWPTSRYLSALIECTRDLVSTENHSWRERRLSVPIRNSGGNIRIASDLDIIHCCDSEITPRTRVQSLAKRQMPDHGREPWRPFDCGNRDRSRMPNERRLKRAAVLSGERTSTGPQP
jgi:hypothetical protein